MCTEHEVDTVKNHQLANSKEIIGAYVFYFIYCILFVFIFGCRLKSSPTKCFPRLNVFPNVFPNQKFSSIKCSPWPKVYPRLLNHRPKDLKDWLALNPIIDRYCFIRVCFPVTENKFFFSIFHFNSILFKYNWTGMSWTY